MKETNYEKQEFSEEVAALVAELEKINSSQQGSDTGIDLDSIDEVLKVVFDFAPDAYFIIELDGTLIEGNQKAEQLVGYKREDLIGKNILKIGLISVAQVPKAVKLLMRTAAGKPTGPDIFNVRRKDGTIIDVEITSHPVQVGKRKVVLNIARDTTARKKAEEDLRDSHSLLQATLDSTTDGILVVDTNGNMASFNQKFIEMWRIPDDIASSGDDKRAIGFVLDQLSEPDVFIRKVEELYNKPESESFDVLEFKDGRVFERFSVPQRIEDKIVGRVWSFRDVTVRRRAEEVQRALFRISEATNTSMNMEDLLRQVHEILDTLVAAPNMLVALYNDSKASYTFPYLVDEYDDDYPEQQLPYSLTDYVRRTGKPLLVDPEVQKSLEKTGEVKLVGTDSPSWMGAPLKTMKGIIGVVVVQSYTEPDVYSEQDLDLLNFVSDHIAVAIERKRTEDQLRQFSLGIERSDEAIFLTDPEGVINSVNPAFEKIYGYTPEEAIGNTPRILKSGEHPDEVYEQFWKKLLDKEVVTGELINKSKDGRLVTVDGSANPILDEMGNITGFLAIQHDITERKNAEEERVKLSEDLAKRVKEISCLYAVGEVIETEKVDEDLFTKVSSMVKEGMTVPEKVWCRISFDGEVCTASSENVNEDVKVVNEIVAFEKHRGLVEVGYSENIEILKEEGAMFSNITRRLGMAIERDELAEQAVEKEKLEMVQKLSGAIAHEFNQPLQALTLIADLMDKADWKGNDDLLRSIPNHIKRISELVEKMTHVMTLETKPYAAGEDIIDIYSSGERKAADEKKVLIIDDEEPILRLLTRVVNNEGYEVDSSLTAEDGLKLMKNNEYGLVISDVNLPGMSGVELYEKIREKNPEIAFVFISGFAIEHVHKAVIAQSAGFIPKPFNTGDIVDILNRILKD